MVYVIIGAVAFSAIVALFLCWLSAVRCNKEKQACIDELQATFEERVEKEVTARIKKMEYEREQLLVDIFWESFHEEFERDTELWM